MSNITSKNNSSVFNVFINLFINDKYYTLNDVERLISKEPDKFKEFLLSNVLIRSGPYCIYDRLKDPKNMSGTYISPIPEWKDVSLEEAIKDSQNQLLKLLQEKNKTPCLLLSGGIDSTLVFYALNQMNIPFLVASDQNAFLEYPLLFNKILKNEFPNVKLYRLVKDAFYYLQRRKDLIFVTGEIGDQIMGSMITMNFPYEERNLSLLEAIIIDLFKIRLVHDRDRTNIFDNFTLESIKYFNSILKWLNKTIETCTVAEFLWALNFIYKYTFVIYRLYSFNMIQYGTEKNTYHFYDTEKFQQYSMSHYEENCAYEKDNEYKQPFKDWIYSQNHDNDFRVNKLKVPSLRVSDHWNLKMKEVKKENDNR